MGEIIIEIRTSDPHHSEHAAIKCPDFFKKCFEPLRVNDNPVSCLLDGGVMVDSEPAKEVLKLREDAAEYLAGELANFIVGQMKRRDTKNGYQE